MSTIAPLTQHLLSRNELNAQYIREKFKIIAEKEKGKEKKIKE